MVYSLPTIDLKISSFNAPNINVDVLSKSFIHGPTDTRVHPPPPLLNPPPIRISCHSYTALHRIPPRAPLKFLP